MTARALIYTRISSDRTGAGLGVARQEQDCRELADRLGWHVVDVYSDNDISAYSGKVRPGYQAMLAEIEAGRADAVVVWHTDRLHRSPSELEHYAVVTDTKGVTTQTVKAGHLDLSTPSGRLVARQLGAVARYEVEQMSVRQRRKTLEKAQAGQWKGGRRPFGYEADGVTVREVEAQALQSAARAVLAGESLRGIAKRWNEQLVTTTTGGRWDPTGVRRVLLRPRTAGLMEHRGEVIGEASWDAIVPPEQWQALRTVLTSPGRRSTTGNARRWLGSGLYRCEVCRETVVGTTTNGRKAYRCRRGCISRSLHDVDRHVSEVVVAWLRESNHLRDLLARTKAEVDLPSREAEAMMLRARLDQLTTLFARGAIDAEQLAEGSKDLRLQLDEVRQDVASAYSGTALAGVADAPDPGKKWASLPLEGKQAVIDVVFDITLLKGAGGRPRGWSPGKSYFRHELVRIEPR
jgi:site-specific DNA recombinase